MALGHYIGARNEQMNQFCTTIGRYQTNMHTTVVQPLCSISLAPFPIVIIILLEMMPQLDKLISIGLKKATNPSGRDLRKLKMTLGLPWKADFVDYIVNIGGKKMKLKKVTRAQFVKEVFRCQDEEWESPVCYYNYAQLNSIGRVLKFRNSRITT